MSGSTDVGLATSSFQFAASIHLLGLSTQFESLSGEEAEKVTRLMSGQPVAQPSLSDAAVGILTRYWEFHRYLDRAASNSVARLNLCVSFSDSAFISASDRQTITDVATRVMLDCYEHAIPVRIGIAHGTIGSAMFSNSMSRGTLIARNQFFGTATIWSSRAAQAGAKGLRVLVHPSAELPSDDHPQSLVPRLQETERSECSTREVNFLPRDMGTDSHWAMCRHSLDMMRKNVGLEGELAHYDASQEALDRLESLLRSSSLDHRRAITGQEAS